MREPASVEVDGGHRVVETRVLFENKERVEDLVAKVGSERGWTPDDFARCSMVLRAATLYTVGDVRKLSEQRWVRLGGLGLTLGMEQALEDAVRIADHGGVVSATRPTPR